METYIKGTYKRCIFSSNDGYTIGLIKIKETDDQDLLDYVGKQFTFTGLFADLNVDENYTFYGNTVDNPKYGIQYKVNRYEKLMPEDKDGLIIFLSSDIFPKVGEKIAKQIILDLKGKIEIDGDVSDDSTADLFEVLQGLGYKTSEINKVIKNVDPSLNVEMQVKEALKLLLR